MQNSNPDPPHHPQQPYHPVHPPNSQAASIHPSLTWETLYDRLAQFKARHGHIDVPFTYDPYLANWVIHQRRDKPNLMLVHRHLLNRLGFSWSMPPPIPQTPVATENDNSPDITDEKKRKEEDFASIKKERIHWDSMYEKYKTFMRAGNNYNDYNSNNNTNKNDAPPDLEEWVQEQRKQYKNKSLSKDRQSMLNYVGITWDLDLPIDAQKPRDKKSPNNGTTDDPPSWEAMFEKLKEFRESHGHCLMPINWRPNPALSSWCSRQRKAQAAGELSDEKEKLLKDLGFLWMKGKSKSKAAKRKKVDTGEQKVAKSTTSDTGEAKKAKQKTVETEESPYKDTLANISQSVVENLKKLDSGSTFSYTNANSTKIQKSDEGARVATNMKEPTTQLLNEKDATAPTTVGDAQQQAGTSNSQPESGTVKPIFQYKFTTSVASNLQSENEQPSETEEETQRRLAEEATIASIRKAVQEADRNRQASREMQLASARQQSIKDQLYRQAVFGGGSAATGQTRVEAAKTAMAMAAAPHTSVMIYSSTAVKQQIPSVQQPNVNDQMHKQDVAGNGSPAATQLTVVAPTNKSDWPVAETMSATTDTNKENERKAKTVPIMPVVPDDSRWAVLLDACQRAS